MVGLRKFFFAFFKEEKQNILYTLNISEKDSSKWAGDKRELLSFSPWNFNMLTKYN